MDSVQQLSLFDNEGSQKRCPRCPEGEQWHPATEAYFNKSKGRPDGLEVYCRQCKAAAYQKDKERILERQRQYRETHKEQKSETDRRYRTENREAVLTQKKRYRQEKAEELATKQRAYYLEHHVERLTYKKNYNQSENGIIAKRADSHNRRARRKNAPGKHTAEQLREQLQRQEGKCFYCHCILKTERDSWNADHIVPLSRGGSNDISNIVISCPPCNRAKHDKLPHEWPISGKLV